MSEKTSNINDVFDEIFDKVERNPELRAAVGEQRHYNGPMPPKNGGAEEYRRYEKDLVAFANRNIASGRFYTAISLLTSTTRVAGSLQRHGAGTGERIPLYYETISNCKRKLYSQYPGSILERVWFFLRRPEIPVQLRV